MTRNPGLNTQFAEKLLYCLDELIFAEPFMNERVAVNSLQVSSCDYDVMVRAQLPEGRFEAGWRYRFIGERLEDALVLAAHREEGAFIGIFCSLDSDAECSRLESWRGTSSEQPLLLSPEDLSFDRVLGSVKVPFDLNDAPSQYRHRFPQYVSDDTLAEVCGPFVEYLTGFLGKEDYAAALRTA